MHAHWLEMCLLVIFKALYPVPGLFRMIYFKIVKHGFFFFSEHMELFFYCIVQKQTKKKQAYFPLIPNETCCIYAGH